MKDNDITGALIDIFINIHSRLGPGLLESIYEEVICYELKKRNLNFKRQEGIEVFYDGNKNGYWI